jgi:excinuclease UvrABC ATPase subunit
MPCPKCGGNGVFKKPVTMQSTTDEVCDECDGLGYLPGEFNGLLLGRLDRIIELLEKGKADAGT